ncbi:MAG: hypothetical protein AB1499_14895 [Nitrospirota bacterium]
MQKIVVLFLAAVFLLCNSLTISQVQAQTEKIASIETAKKLAADAGGTYVEGATAPALTGNQVALPVIDEATGNVIGHIVAEQSSMVSALNAAGYTEVGAALAATEAGAGAGLAVGAGISAGTIGAGAAAAAAAIGLVVASTGGGDSDTTSQHTTTTHH